MRSVNKVILVGNLTRDPEMKQAANGQAVVTFGIATNRDWVNKEGERQSSAEFHEVVAFARLAEICGQFLKKGNLIYIEGYLKTRSWVDEASGQKRYRTEIVVNDMIRLEKRADGDMREVSAPTPDMTGKPGASAEDAFGDESNDDKATPTADPFGDTTSAEAVAEGTKESKENPPL